MLSLENEYSLRGTGLRHHVFLVNCLQSKPDYYSIAVLVMIINISVLKKGKNTFLLSLPCQISTKFLKQFLKMSNKS